MGLLQSRPASAATVVRSRGEHLKGKVYVITGASNGIGLECAKALASGGATIVLACRMGQKAVEAMEEVQAVSTRPIGQSVHLLPVDLGDRASVKECAKSFLNLNMPLHALINNAGCNGVPDWGQLTPGIESQFAVNLCGHYLLTELLHNKLAATDGSRVVVLASEAHRRITRWEALPPAKETYDPLRAYAFSNLCRILWTRAKAAELRAKGSPYPIVCLHPGVAGGTGMMQHMTARLVLRQLWLVVQHELGGVLRGQSVEQIAACQTYAAIAPVADLAEISGGYLNGNDNPRVARTACEWDDLKATLGKPATPTALAQSDELAAEVVACARHYCEPFFF